MSKRPRPRRDRDHKKVGLETETSLETFITELHAQQDLRHKTKNHTL